MFTFSELLASVNSSQCELLLIDAEGADVDILHSMIDACVKKICNWPSVIAFETHGHAGVQIEEDMVRKLQALNYLLVYAGDDCVFLSSGEVRNNDAFGSLADQHFTLTCQCGKALWPTHEDFRNLAGKGFTQWRYFDKWNCYSWLCKQCASNNDLPYI